mgnify:CR=1 FL=1
MEAFPDKMQAFPGQNIRGGVCYFLWDKNHKGLTNIINYKDNNYNLLFLIPNINACN